MKKLIAVALAILCLTVSAGCSVGNGNSGGVQNENSSTKAESVKKTYKKYFTLSFDDGTYEDEKMTALLKKYGVKASFCINAGLMDGNDVIEVAGNWKRMSFDYAKEN